MKQYFKQLDYKLDMAYIRTLGIQLHVHNKDAWYRKQVVFIANGLYSVHLL